MHILSATLDKIRAHACRWASLPLFPSEPIPAPAGHPESDEPNAPHKGEDWSR